MFRVDQWPRVIGDRVLVSGSNHWSLFDGCTNAVDVLMMSHVQVSITSISSAAQVLRRYRNGLYSEDDISNNSSGNHTMGKIQHYDVVSGAQEMGVVGKTRENAGKSLACCSWVTVVYAERGRSARFRHPLDGGGRGSGKSRNLMCLLRGQFGETCPVLTRLTGTHVNGWEDCTPAFGPV